MRTVEGHHCAPPFATAVHDELVAGMLATLEESQQRGHRARLRYANAQSHRQRIGELIDRAAEVIRELRRHAKRLRDELVDTRNQYTPFGDPGPNVVPPNDLHPCVERLQLVLEVKLFRDLGVDHALIPNLVGHAYQDRIP